MSATDLTRVRLKLADRILAWWGLGHTSFTMAELLAFIRISHPHIAPDSPRRVMALLRDEGELNYFVDQSNGVFFPAAVYLADVEARKAQKQRWRTLHELVKTQAELIAKYEALLSERAVKMGET